MLVTGATGKQGGAVVEALLTRGHQLVQGYAADIKSLRRDFPEVKWHTFEEWAGRQEWSVLDQN